MIPESKKVEIKKPAILKEEDFKSLRELIFELSGIYLQDHKQELLKARLLKRLRVLGLETYQEYYNYLNSKDFNSTERVQLLNAISTNKTEFFREAAHFKFLANKGLPDFENESEIRILCAACSTGEEAYSIAMTVQEHYDERSASKVTIHACDINTQVLEHAKKGIYPMASVESISKDRLHRFFLQGVRDLAGYVQVCSELKNMVQFRHHNLIERLPFEFGFNLIFCRNVVIYFDRDTQKNVFQRLYNALAPRGFLVLGHSESLAFFDIPTQYIQPSVYQKKSR